MIILRIIIDELVHIVLKYGFVIGPNSTKKYRFSEMPTPANDRQNTKRLFTENFRTLNNEEIIRMKVEDEQTPARPSRWVTTQPSNQSTS